MIKKILIASVARSDYSIIEPVLQKLVSIKKYKISKIISSSNYLNIEENIKQKVGKYDYLIKNKLKNDNPHDTNKVISNVIKKSSAIFSVFKPDLLILTGDRYEMLSMAIASIPYNFLVAHIHGGETSLGSFDEKSRHAITKLSQIHFPATKNAAKKIQQMGEKNYDIVLSGAPSLDRILSKKRTKKDSFMRLKDKFKIDKSDEIILITFHPVTIDFDNEMDNLNIIFEVLSKFKNKLIFTSPGADPQYKVIFNSINEFVKKNKNAIFINNFGEEYYYDIMNVSKLMFGNSSSGIIEAASLNLPVVNVGKRQLGRETSGNVIHAEINEESLFVSINKGLSLDFQKYCKTVNNIYYQGGAGDIITKKIDAINKGNLSFNKFYN